MAQTHPYGGAFYGNQSQPSAPPPPYTVQPGFTPGVMPGAVQYGQPGQPIQIQLQMPQMSTNMLCMTSLSPVQIQCPHCHSQVSTFIDREVGSRTYVIAAMCICMGCCCFLPCLWEGMKDVIHRCSNCKQEVGRYLPTRGGGRHHLGY
ncbi:cell death-inducing p53-target protein 1-like [Littorina saxatilis]|uniref:cell death-inducing p53-target protein 1-like n=1 Tax=Littorina saxatilis TaxID=31220 RepID=UPI0038B58028